jgi:hypothetical protein
MTRQLGAPAFDYLCVSIPPRSTRYCGAALGSRTSRPVALTSGFVSPIAYECLREREACWPAAFACRSHLMQNQSTTSFRIEGVLSEHPAQVWANSFFAARAWLATAATSCNANPRASESGTRCLTAERARASRPVVSLIRLSKSPSPLVTVYIWGSEVTSARGYNTLGSLSF